MTMAEDQEHERRLFAPSTAPTRLYAFLLRIRPLQAGSLMAFSGELVHGAFLRWLRQTAPDVSEWLHDGNKRRLFTCSSLQFGLPPQRMLNAERENVHLPLDPQKTYLIRVTLLLGELFPLLHESLLRFYPDPHNQDQQQDTSQFLQIGKQRFTLEEVITTPTHPSGQCGFASLGKLVEQAQGLSGSALEQLTLEFDSLTTFNRSNRDGYGVHHALLPLPQYLFPNLARRWDDIAPAELAALVQHRLIEDYTQQDGVIISDYDLHPHHVHFTTHQQAGFIGRCTYRMRDPARLAATHAENGENSSLSIPQQLWLLSQLAFYSGIGYKTSMGLGRARTR